MCQRMHRSPSKVMTQVKCCSMSMPLVVPRPPWEDAHEDGASQVAHVLDLDMKAAERLAVAIDVAQQVVTVVKAAQFVPKLHRRIEQRVESAAEGPLIGFIDHAKDGVDVLLRHRPRSIEQRQQKGGRHGPPRAKSVWSTSGEAGPC